MDLDTACREFECQVLSRLRRLALRLRVYLLLDGLAMLSLAVLAAVAVTFAVDRAFQLTLDMRAAQLTTLLLALAGLGWYGLARPLRLGLSHAALALLVERRYPVLRSRLISAVEFAEAVRQRPTDRREPSPAMLAALIAQAGRAVATVNFAAVLNHTRARRRFALALTCPLALTALCLLTGPAMGVWFERNLLLRDIEWPQRNRLVIEGLTHGRIIVPRDDDLTITARVVEGFEPPRQVFISFESAGGTKGQAQMPATRAVAAAPRGGRRPEIQMPATPPVAAAPRGGRHPEIQTPATPPVAAAPRGGRHPEIPMPATPPKEPTGLSPDAEGPMVDQPVIRFTHTFEQVRETLKASVWGGDARTDEFIIEVVDRPRISEVHLSVTPPAYTRLAPYDLRPGQTVAEVLNGSRVDFRVSTDRPVVEAVLMRQSGDEIRELGPALHDATQPLGREFTISDQPPASATYHFQLLDEQGLSNISDRGRPVRISVRLVPDKPPVVKLTAKGVGEMILPQAVLPVEVDCTDGYGLAGVTLVCELPGKEGTPLVEPIEGFEPESKVFQRTIEWVPARRGLIEGDRLILRAEAVDFDDVAGPNIGRSSALGLRVVSREELLAELSRREQEYRQDFERLVRQQEDLYSELLARMRPASPPQQQNDTEPTSALARRQRDYAGRINGLRLQFEQVLSELRINQLATPAAEDRVGRRIVRPLESLHRSDIPTAAERIELFARERTAETFADARAAQERILALMRTVLADMLQWEGFQEAITLLRDIQKLQSEISRETDQRIESELFGPKPQP